MKKITVLACVAVAILASLTFSSCGPKPSKQDPSLSYYTRAHEYFIQNKPAKAIPLYRKAIKYKVTFGQAYHELAVCYQQIGDDEKAITNYEGAIVYNPRDVDAYQSIGNIYFMNGDFDNALTWYDRGSEVNYLYPRSYNNMGTIWYMRHEYDQARKYFSQAIAVDPTYPRAYYGLGLVALGQDDTTEAESRFLDAVRVDSLPEAMYMLGLLYFDTVKYEQSETWLNRYLEKEPAGEWADKSKDMLAVIKQKRGEGK